MLNVQSRLKPGPSGSAGGGCPRQAPGLLWLPFLHPALQVSGGTCIPGGCKGVSCRLFIKKKTKQKTIFKKNLIEVEFTYDQLQIFTVHRIVWCDRTST